jgi:hypothetical protein
METTHQPIQHRGSCHCGAVRFEALVDATRGSRCNCTACMKVSGTTAIVKPDAFVLLQGEADLSEYAWGGKTGTRYFCKHCGVHVFLRGHLEELGGAYVSVALNCLDDVDLRDVEVGYWDGRNNNWMAGLRPAPWPIKPEA